MDPDRINPKPPTGKAEDIMAAPKRDKRPGARAGYLPPELPEPPPETPPEAARVQSALQEHTATDYVAYGVKKCRRGYVIVKVFMRDEYALYTERVTDPEPSRAVALGYIEQAFMEDYLRGR